LKLIGKSLDFFFFFVKTKAPVKQGEGDIYGYFTKKTSSLWRWC
jgi:hypothetical protein